MTSEQFLKSALQIEKEIRDGYWEASSWETDTSEYTSISKEVYFKLSRRNSYLFHLIVRREKSSKNRVFEVSCDFLERDKWFICTISRTISVEHVSEFSCSIKAIFEPKNELSNDPGLFSPENLHLRVQVPVFDDDRDYSVEEFETKIKSYFTDFEFLPKNWIDCITGNFQSTGKLTKSARF